MKREEDNMLYGNVKKPNIRNNAAQKYSTFNLMILKKVYHFKYKVHFFQKRTVNQACFKNVLKFYLII